MSGVGDSRRGAQTAEGGYNRIDGAFLSLKRFRVWVYGVCEHRIRTKLSA